MKKLNEENTNGYLVFGIGAGAPTVIHENEGSAINEANGLSMKFPGKMFCVCKIKYTVKTTMMPYQAMRSYE